MLYKNRSRELIEKQLRSKGPDIPEYMLDGIRKRTMQLYLDETDFVPKPALITSKHKHLRISMTAAVLLIVLSVVFIYSKHLQTRADRNALQTVSSLSTQFRERLPALAGSPESIINDEIEQVRQDMHGALNFILNVLPEQISADLTAEADS